MKTTDVLTQSELHWLTQRSDLQGGWMLMFNWIIITGCFVLVAVWPHFFTVFLALMVLAGRQLGLSVLMHECGHHILFERKSFNAFFGRWLAAAPLFLDMFDYAKGHLVHHQQSGTLDDPDLPNYQAYPIKKQSLKRKIIRDITGQTAFKVLSVSKGVPANQDRLSHRPHNNRSLRNGCIANVLLFSMLLAAGHPSLYIMWPAAYLTFYMLFLRIRQIAEHAAVPDRLNKDPRQYTRTTWANPLERLLVAPNRVNYHLEHHLLPAVPCYHLKALHEILQVKGFYAQTEFPKGYLSMIRSVIY